MTLLLTALGAVLRFSALSRQSFWYDEAVSVALARHSVWELVTGRAKDLGNPPLYPVLLHLWTRVFGMGDGSVRALSALFGTATIPVVVALARRAFPARVAFLGATLLAVAPFHLQMSQEARAYTLLSFLGACAGLALVRATETPRRVGPWIGLALATAGLGLTHYFGFFLAFAQALSLTVVHRRDRAILGRAALAYLGAALLFSFWIPALRAQMGVSGNLARSAESWYLHLFATPLVFSLGTTLVWKDAASWPRLLLGVLGAVAFTASCWLGLYRTVMTPAARRNPYTLLLVSWLVVPVLIPAAISVLASPLYNTRYVIVASLPFFLFTAAGLYELGANARTALAGLMVIAMGASTMSYLRRPVKHQWREAARFVEAVRLPSDLLLFDADYNETAYAHYAGPGGDRIRLLAPPEGAGASQFYGAIKVGDPPADLTGQVAAHDRVWLILADAGRDNADRERALFAPAQWQAHPETVLRGITVQLFTKLGAPKP